jgi:hypothetical protein
LIYEDAPACGISETIDEEGALVVSLGSRIIAKVARTNELPIEDYIHQLMEGAENVEIYPTPIAGRTGYLVHSRFGGLGRLEQIYLVDLGDLRVSLGLTPPWVCDFPEVNVFEPEVFERLAETISLIP